MRPLILPLALSLITVFGCGKSAPDPNGPKKTDGDLKMIKNLEYVRNSITHPANVYAADAKLNYLESQISQAKDPKMKTELLTKKAAVLLEAGKEAESVALYDQLIAEAGSDKAAVRALRPFLGMACLRLAERSNCINSHSDGACIMPIQGGGVHNDKTPARRALEIFTAVMNENPDDLDSRWLLNLAGMTLGEYPAGIPARWLIPGLDKPDQVAVKPFTDIAADLKLDIKNRGGGVIVDDFDNDGMLDIVSSAWDLTDPLHYFHNNGDGTFTDASKASGLAAFTGGINIMQTDYNNDGYIDIYVCRGAWQGMSGFGEQPNSLIRNNGDGTFTDVTIEAKMLSYRPCQSAVWNDFNRDGWLDLFVGNETTEPQHLYPCELYVNNQDGTFTNVASPQGLNIISFVKGVTSGDYDNDGWPDIFLSCLNGDKFLLRNKGVQGKVPAFEDVTTRAGIEKANTFATFFFDYDNDGNLDIFMCNYSFDRQLSYYAAKEALNPSPSPEGKMYLYHNNGNGTFTNMAPSMQVNQVIYAMGNNFGDFDNDGWLDMYMATGNPSYQSVIPNKLYKNLGGKDFADVTTSARVGNLQKGHGVAFVDLNNNGDQDIFVDMGGAYKGDAYYTSFFLNPGQNGNNWITVQLEGKKTNKVAIGARLSLKVTENGVQRTIYRDVNSGGSFGSSPLRREIGIGAATVIDELTVTWPVSGEVQTFRNIQPRQFIRITEGEQNPEVLDIKPLVFRRSDGTVPMCAPR